MIVDKVASGVWRAGTRFVNWYLVDGGEAGLTVVDGGLPGYRDQLDQALRRIGREPAQVKALVLTHGHLDHTGLAAVLADRDVPVYLHRADETLAAKPNTNRTQSGQLRYLPYPATLAFVAHALANGATKPIQMPATVALDDGATLPIPGTPTVTHVGGHTAGSCVLTFAAHGVVLCGDLLCTISPVTGRRNPPQLQTRGSNTDSDAAMAALARIEEIEARVVLPGHGSPWTDGVEAAVASARRIGCR
jgi:glyoxylase-like metal-dependent hydrolase (beta-lactamase superfamily II)